MPDTLTPRPEPRYPSLANSARSLTASSSHGSLATLDPRQGYPYASMLELLPVDQGDVVFFISTLAAHTTNLTQDPRASLLLTDPMGHASPLAHERVTLMGQVKKVEDRSTWRDAFLEQHPGALNYIDFSDFSFWRLHVERARYIAGFGRMNWLEEDDYAKATPDILSAHRLGMIAHMNDDHHDNLLDYLHAFAKLDWAKCARMTSIDELGFDVEAYGDHEDSGKRVRLMFLAPLTEAKQARAQLVHMAHEARDFLGDKAHAKG